MKGRMKKSMLSLGIVLILMSMIGCASGDKSSSVMEQEAGNMTEETSDISMDYDAVDDYEAKPMEDENYGVDGSSNVPVGMNLDDSRKYILTYNYEMETLTFDETQTRLNQLINMHSGYYESTQISGRNMRANYTQRRYGNFTIRIPKDQIVDFLEGLKTIGANILNETSDQDDVTNQYYDLDARIKTLEVQEERLISILETADELEYIIELERELSDVRYEIERNMSSFRNLENRISYTTVHLSLQEVIEETVIDEEPTSFIDKMSYGFKQSVKAVGRFFEALALFFITQSPILLVVFIFGFVGYKVIRWMIKKIFQSKDKMKE